MHAQRLTIERARDERARTAFFLLKAERYTALDFLTNEECPQGQASDKFDEHAVHFLVFSDDDKHKNITGAFRLVTHSEHGLPVTEVFTFNDPNIPIREFFEVSSLLTRRKGGFVKGVGRGHFIRSIIVPALCYSIAFTERNGYRGFVTMIDPELFGCVNRNCCNILQPVPGHAPTFYRGGWLIPTYVTTEHFEKSGVKELDVVRTYLDRIDPLDVLMS